MTGAVSIGVAGALGPDAIADIAADAERLGFSALWVNDTPDGDAVAALVVAAAATERLVLATGVVPVDRVDPDTLARRAAALPPERSLIGIGSGAAREGALGRVADAVTRLRAGDVRRVYVGALGPRMRRLGAERADGVLLNWVTPALAEEQRSELREVAEDVRLAVYVRTALDDAARPRLAAEAARYASYPNYAAHFARSGTTAIQTTFDGGDALRSGLDAYRRSADEVVLRAITPTDDAAAYRDFVERAAHEAFG